MTLEIFLGVFFALLAFDFCKSIENIWSKYRERMKEIETDGNSWRDIK